jgi:hypothetical protein
VEEQYGWDLLEKIALAVVSQRPPRDWPITPVRLPTSCPLPGPPVIITVWRNRFGKDAVIDDLSVGFQFADEDLEYPDAFYDPDRDYDDEDPDADPNDYEEDDE